MSKQTILCISYLVLVLCSPLLAREPRKRAIYVDALASGAGDGSSWQNAYPLLQDALAHAEPNDELWIAQGTYYPDQGADVTKGDRNASFTITMPLSLKGGYAGAQAPQPGAWDPNLYPTILSGDLESNDISTRIGLGLLDDPSRAENAMHVVTIVGINASKGAPPVTLNSLIITGGHAFGATKGGVSGGGINSNSSALIISNCTFIANTSYDQGGAIYSIRNTEMKIKNCLFRDNAANSGGALYNRMANLSLHECHFYKNNAMHGGGGAYISGHEITIADCTFESNSGATGGGFSTSSVDDLSVKNCFFIGNRVTDFGGGVYNTSDGKRLFTGCIFRNNHANWYGGGLYGSYDSVLILQRCLFENNGTDGWGAALHFYDSVGMINHCTFVRNKSDRGSTIACGFDHEAMAVSPSHVMVTNSIIWDEGEPLYNHDYSFLSVTYSLLSQYSSPNARPASTYPNPHFASLGYWDTKGNWIEGDYHLKSQAGRWDPQLGTWVMDNVTSPCIDAGNPNDSAKGEPQPNGGIVNMGIYGNTHQASMSITSD